MKASAATVSGTLLREQTALALYELTVIDGELQATSTSTETPFQATEYSRFKYGDYAQTVQYGSLLAEALGAHFGEMLEGRSGEQIVLSGTPYKSMPNAAKLLAGVAERQLAARGFATTVGRIYQHRLAEGDYGTLSQAMRDERNRQKKYFFDPSDFAGKHVVVVDDVRITGSIERSVLRLLGDINWLSLTIINLVRLDPEVSLRNPQIEDTLNHASVCSLADLLPLMAARDQFVLITRTVKRILEADPSELREFLSVLEPARRTELYLAAVDDGYSTMERYAQSFQLLTEFYPF